MHVLCAKSLQSCPTLCDPMDHSPPGSFVHGILQARILEWVAMPSSKGSSQPRDWTVSLTFAALAGRFFTTSATWEDQNMHNCVLIMRELQADPKCRTFCKITCPVLQKFITFPGYKRQGNKIQHRIVNSISGKLVEKTWWKPIKACHLFDSIVPNVNILISIIILW